jgi:hypothetical protein
MSRPLGPTQRRVLDLVRQYRRLTIEQLAELARITPRRCRAVAASLEARWELRTSRGKVGTQANGRAVHGMVVWEWDEFGRDRSVRRNAERYAQQQRELRQQLHERERERRTCPTCGQVVPPGTSVR